jgi:hypothetical protein
MKARPPLLAAILIALAIITPQCKSHKDNTSENQNFWGENSPKVTEENSLFVFRNLFYTYLKQSNYPDERIQQLIFMPPKEILQEPTYGSSPEQGFADLRSTFARYRASHLYETGLKIPFHKIPQPEQTFAKSGPITIVLIPGILGEFIEKRPFEEALETGQFWQKNHILLNTSRFPVYSLEHLKPIEEPLAKSVSLGSIDAPSGNPLINVIFLRPQMASLETVGTLQSNNDIYIKKLDLLFSLLSPTDLQNVYIMGYSRGLPVALDLISRTWKERATHPWIHNVRGVVGLGGVFYGTELADDAMDPTESTVTSKGVATLTWVGREIQPVTNPSQLAINTQKWAQVGYEFANLNSRVSNAQSDVTRIDSAALQVDKMDLMATATLLWNTAFTQLNLRAAVSDYNGNVARYKHFISEAYKGLETLGTKQRMAWWKANTIPGHIKIFSITGSMPDMPRGDKPSPLLDFDGYGKNTTDFSGSLRGSFYTLTTVSNGNELNDSQATNYGSRFWPKLTRVINPSQQPLQHYYLGALGTHHWGMAFPIAFKSESGRVNPFPRLALLKSVGTFLSMSQNPSQQ